MAINICPDCGEQFYSHCTNELCIERRIEQVARKTIQNCFQIIGSLAEKLFKENTSGTHEDYREIKKVEKRIDELAKERKWNSPLSEADIKTLKKSCLDLKEEYFSPKARTILDNQIDRKHNLLEVCCKKENLKLDEKDQEYYCDYCWEVDAPKLLRSLQSLRMDEFLKFRDKNHLHSQEVSNILQNFLNISFINQVQFKQTCQQVVQELNQLAKSKGITNLLEESNNNDNTGERERERERAKLQQAITNLTNKPNKTPEEEQELADKQAQLAQLTKPTNTNNNSWLLPTLIISGIIILVIIISLVVKSHKNKHYK